MALAAVQTAGAEGAPITPEVLDRLQWEQFQHDEQYHREIARLTVQDRLKHMALHFAKYAGGLFEATDEHELKRLTTDIFVIGVSSANILNVRLSGRLTVGALDMSDENFRISVVAAAGRMAAACEKMDHLEAFPFRERILAAVLALTGSAATFAAARGWPVEDLVHGRLQPVKEKSIFYGHI